MTKPDVQSFLTVIKDCQRRLKLANLLKILTASLFIGGAVALLFQLLALFLPIYYVNRYSLAALVIALITAFIANGLKKVTMDKAALTIDSFGFQERIITAYENLDREEPIYIRQREDAIKQLKQKKDKIKIPLCPPKKKIGLAVVLLALVFICTLIPTPSKQKAKDLLALKQQTEEKKDEIKEVLKELETLEKADLSQEELDSLKEMIESLNSSLSEYQQASSQEAINQANERLDYKYSDLSKQLSQMSQNTTMTQVAETMQQAANKMDPENVNNNTQQASNAQNNQNGQNAQNNQNGQNSQNGQNGNNGQEQNGNNQNGQNGQNGNNGQDQNGNGQNGNNGQNQNGNSQNGQNGQDGQISGDDQNQNGQGGQNGQNGQGNGNQNGQGGNSNGQSGGNNQGGGGNGSGSGRGEGHSEATHDYVSIPNDIGNDGNLTGNANGSDNDEYFRSQSGLGWEGDHVSHEEVIGNYQESAYEGISQGRYPTGMENVIKDYFTSFNND